MSQTKAQLLAPIGIITGPGLDVTTASGTTFQLGSTGIITAVSANFSGNVTVGGTLTYEDVTSIDSVGVITARSGIDVNAGGIDVTAGGIDVVGVVTASTGINAASNLVLNTGGSERLRIASAGQVGIGGTNYGTSGQVMTSQGNAAAPQWVDSGGAWIKMASADIVGVAGTTYDIFTDFESHTDKKWWRLHYYYDTTTTSNGDLGLNVKIGGVWKSKEYKKMRFSASTSENSQIVYNQDRLEVGQGYSQEQGQVTFWNPVGVGTTDYTFFGIENFTLRHNWYGTGGINATKVGGGYTGSDGSNPIQGIRFVQDQSTWGKLSFALFAGNGW